MCAWMHHLISLPFPHLFDLLQPAPTQPPPPAIPNIFLQIQLPHHFKTAESPPASGPQTANYSSPLSPLVPLPPQHPHHQHPPHPPPASSSPPAPAYPSQPYTPSTPHCSSPTPHPRPPSRGVPRVAGGHRRTRTRVRRAGRRCRQWRRWRFWSWRRGRSTFGAGSRWWRGSCEEGWAV